MIWIYLINNIANRIFFTFSYTKLLQALVMTDALSQSTVTVDFEFFDWDLEKETISAFVSFTFPIFYITWSSWGHFFFVSF